MVGTLWGKGDPDSIHLLGPLTDDCAVDGPYRQFRVALKPELCMNGVGFVVALKSLNMEGVK